MVPGVLVLIVIGVVAALIVREHLVARKAGMSEVTPVCSRCHYLVGGWTSSICPECGTDIREKGVRVGPRTNRIIVSILAIFGSVVVVSLLLGGMMSQRFGQKNVEVQWMYRSSSLPMFFVSLDSEYTWPQIPPFNKRGASMELVYLLQPPTGPWVNGRYVGPEGRREQVIELDGVPDLSAERAIEQAVRAVLDPGTEDPVVAEHVKAVKALARATMNAQSVGELDRDFVLSWTGGVFEGAGGGSGKYDAGMAWPGYAIMAIAIVICSWSGIRIATPLCRAGWRQPHEGEWERVAE